MARSGKAVRVGVLGVRRGLSFASNAEHTGMKLVALCDSSKEKVEEAGKSLEVTAYTDYDEFLSHDMDAVILANYFHQHAPFAIRALEAGKHVMSETSACKTLGEGVALARAVEKSDKIYMLAENYCFFAFNQEMRRLYQAGEIGEVQYAEGEYNHPTSAKIYNQLSPGIDHWRNHIPPTYYCTHAMGPIMSVTNSRPTSVNAQSIARSDQDLETEMVKVGDPGFIAMCRLDNGAISRIMGLNLRGHSIWYRFHGTRGLMENLRTGKMDMVRIVHEDWDRRKGDCSEKIYQPEFPTKGKLAAATGHGGGDFFTSYHFSQAIRTGEPPFQDVYWGLDATLVGIQAWRSALADGQPFEVPDFRDEAVRKRHENDDWSPFPEDRKPGQPWPSIKGEMELSPERLAAAKKDWAEIGYRED